MNFLEATYEDRCMDMTNLRWQELEEYQKYDSRITTEEFDKAVPGIGPCLLPDSEEPEKGNTPRDLREAEHGMDDIKYTR